MSLIRMLIRWHVFVFALLAILTRNTRILKGYVGIHLIGAVIVAVLWLIINGPEETIQKLMSHPRSESK